jgi:hypothetical protein
MWHRDPRLFPQNPTDAGYRKNPMGTEPFPYPSGMPVALWNVSPIKMAWVTTGLPDGIFARCVWSTPVFDLRPSFRNAGMPKGSGQGYLVAQAPSLSTTRQPNAVATVASNTGAVPIWKPSGAGGKLWVQVTNLTSGPVAGQTGFGFQVLAKEMANINDPTDLQQIAPREDITSDFVGRIPSAIPTFLPPGSGYPVRYYRVSLTFQYRKNITVAANWSNGDGNPMRITAAYY